jgi:hypothetical protein
MRKVCVLYEDQRGPTRGFGLHELVKACVSDALPDPPRWKVNAALADCRPLKGDTKLLEACRRDVDLIASDGRAVVAVFDNDKIRELLRLPANASDVRVVQAILKGGTVFERLFIVLLKQNMESVIAAAAQCDKSLSQERIKLAVRHKDPLERDAILTELSSERNRPIRECMLDKVPSLRTLVDLLCRQLMPAQGRRRKKRARGRRAVLR